MGEYGADSTVSIKWMCVDYRDPGVVLVRQAGYIVNWSDFYSYRLIGKLTAFLQLQEFSQRNQPVVSSTSAVRLSHISSREKLTCLSERQQLYVLILT